MTEDKPKTIWPYFAPRPDPERERREKIKEIHAEKKILKAKMKILQAEIKRGTAKNTNYGIITDISKNTADLYLVTQTIRGTHSVRVLKRLHKQVERFSKRYLPKLERIYFNDEQYDSLLVKKLETIIFIMRMRYDILKRYNDKILVTK